MRTSPFVENGRALARDARVRATRMRIRAAAVVATLSLSAVPAAAGQITSSVLIDRDISVGAGATISVTAGELLARAEDAVVPGSLFSERGIARRSANITYRLVKLAYFDLPQEQWLVVATHEVFGHGGRLRERFDGPIGYRVDAPVPYGDGGGVTSFVFDRDPTVYELLAVSAAGMEVDAVAARLMAQRAVSERRMSVRDAIRYLDFELDTFGYILGTDDEPEEPGHDVSDFVQEYNNLAAAAGSRRLAPRTLRREVLISLANPMLGYAAFGIGRYLWSGAKDVRVPALSIAGVRYLPMVRYQLTPYGTEWAVMNELAGRVRPTQIEVRMGRAVGARPWGVGMRQRERAVWRKWRLDVGVDVWRQPRIDAISPATATTETRVGAEVRVRAERPLIPVWFSSSDATLIVDVGLKTAGFVPGEPLRRGAVIRGGAGLPLGR